MIPKSRGEDLRPVTLVGYEEGPHPLMSGKVVVGLTPVIRSTSSYLILILSLKSKEKFPLVALSQTARLY